MFFSGPLSMCIDGSSAIRKMRDSPQESAWRHDLRTVSCDETILPFRESLLAVANSRDCAAPILHFATEGLRQYVALEECIKAAGAALTYVDQRPEAAWVLCALAVGAWEQNLGGNAGRVAPRPGEVEYEVWTTLPRACALACLAINCTRAADLFLRATIDFIWTASIGPGMVSEPRSQLDSHAELSRRVSRRLASLNAALAEDLRTACEAGEETVRPLVGADALVPGRRSGKLCRSRQCIIATSKTLSMACRPLGNRHA